MTTDTAERTEVQQTEATPPEPVTETTQASDAGLSTGADAAAKTETQSTEETPKAPASVEDYVKSKLGKEGTEQAPEAKQARPDPEVARNAIAQFRKNHEDRQKAIDALQTRLLTAGYSQLETESVLKEVKDTLNSHHADALQYAGYQASEDRWQEAVGEFLEGVKLTVPENLNADIEKAAQANFAAAVKANPEARPEGRLTFPDYMKAIVDTQVKAAEAKAYERGLSEGYQDGLSTGEANAKAGSSGQNVEGNVTRTRSGPLTVEEAETLSVEELRAIRARENGQ